MSGLFPKAPKAPDVIPPPEKSDAEVQQDADAQRKKFYGTQSGGAANMLTGGRGITGGYTSAAAKLLGGATV